MQSPVVKRQAADTWEQFEAPTSQPEAALERQQYENGYEQCSGATAGYSSVADKACALVTCEGIPRVAAMVQGRVQDAKNPAVQATCWKSRSVGNPSSPLTGRVGECSG